LHTHTTPSHSQVSYTYCLTNSMPVDILTKAITNCKPVLTLMLPNLQLLVDSKHHDDQ
jgi:hypothetical protein